MTAASAGLMSASIRRHITNSVRAALGSAQASGKLPEVDVDDLSIERPQKAENGDFSCSLAMKLARPMRMNPRAIGQAIVDSLPDSDIVGKVWIAGPGFVNFALDDGWLQFQVDRVIQQGEEFGNSDLGGGGASRSNSSA